MNDRFDEAIDRAVRGVMDVDPRTDMSRLVLARLRAPGTRWLTAPRLAVAAALIVVAGVTTILLTRTPSPNQQQFNTGRTVSTAPHAEAPAPVPSPRAASLPASGASDLADRAARRNAPAREVIPPFVSFVDVAPLASVEPITVAPVRPRSLDAPQLTVQPLDIEPLRVDPLSSAPY